MALGPLAGFTVAVTADRRADEQIELLRRRGARVLHGPSVRTLPLADDEGVRAALHAVLADPPDIVVLLTGLGTRSLFGVAESVGAYDALPEVLQRATVVARGPKAAGAATTVGVEVEWKAPSERGSEVFAHLLPAARAGARIAVQRDGDVRPLLADALRAEGANVVDIPVYRWELPDDLGPAGRVVDAVCAGQVDAITFTSSPGIRNLLDLAGERRAEFLTALGSVTVTCVGPVCAETAAGVGLERSVQPQRARLGAMVQALAVAFEGRALRLEGGTVVQGAAVSHDGASIDVELADRERAVLERLALAGGSVVSKAELLRAVWGAGDADEHVVEVTVGRLRRRLGPGGAALATVSRRGYRLVATRSSNTTSGWGSGDTAAATSVRPSQA